MSDIVESINEPHVVAVPAQRPVSINEPPPPITVESLDPTSAEIGGADLALRVIGTGFTEAALIIFNGGPETTTFVSDTELITIVKPSTASVAGDYPVSVAQGGVIFDPPQMFTFSEPTEGVRA